MNIKTILANQTAKAAAESGDFESCAKTLQSITVTAEPRLCYSVETSLAIMDGGGDPNQIMTAMDGDATGRFLLAKLATVGVMWAHPLTAAYLDRAVAANGLGQASRDAAVNLSQPTTQPYADVTADECRTVWTAAQNAASQTMKHAALAEANDAAQHAIADEDISQKDLVKLLTTRLAEAWK